MSAIYFNISIIPDNLKNIIFFFIHSRKINLKTIDYIFLIYNIIFFTYFSECHSSRLSEKSIHCKLCVHITNVNISKKIVSILSILSSFSNHTLTVNYKISFKVFLNLKS